MLANILSYKAGIDAISSKAKKYLEKFFLLSTINQSVKKQCIRMFYNIVKSDLPEVFELIEKCAVKFAEDKQQMAF